MIVYNFDCLDLKDSKMIDFLRPLTNSISHFVGLLDNVEFYSPLLALFVFLFVFFIIKKSVEWR